MPVIALIISTLLFWGIYWFFRMGGLDHLRERSMQRKDTARRAQARESERTATLRAIDDPREAAIILMLLITRGADPTASQLAAIEATMRQVFEFDQDVGERLTHARFVAGTAQGFSDAAGVFADLFNKQLTLDERRELVDMVHDVAKIDGPSATQTENIELLKRRLKLPAT